MAALEVQDAPAFGALLRRHRLAAHLTQAALATRASLSARGIADLERGVRRQPRADTVCQLADGLELVASMRSAFVTAATRTGRGPGTGPPSNLPAARTLFIGRERQLRQVRTTFFTDAARLVSLTGPGGAGKTRLALHAANELRDEFPDGVFVVWLAEINDSDLVPAAVAQAVGVLQRPE